MRSTSQLQANAAPPTVTYPTPPVATVPSPPTDALDAGLIRVASRLAELTLDVRAGAWDPRSAAEAARAGFALILLDGLMIRQVHLDHLPAAQLVIAGDTFDPFGGGGGSVLCGERVTWRAVEPASLGVLGPRFLAAAQRVPALTVALHRSQVEQGGRAARHAAIAQLPRVEQRIVALLCAVGEERGRVVRDGVLVDLPLTHEGIGRLIGAKRPTVSLALKALGADGVVTRRGDQWLIGRAATALGDAPAAAAAARPASQAAAIAA